MDDDEAVRLIESEARMLAAAMRDGSVEAIDASRDHLAAAVESAGSAPVLLAALTALRSVADAAVGRGSGLAAQAGGLEPGSLAERMLEHIADGVTYSNADLVEALGSDPWQVSRAGKKLREAGLADRQRVGRINMWRVTSAGERERNGGRS